MDLALLQLIGKPAQGIRAMRCQIVLTNAPRILRAMTRPLLKAATIDGDRGEGIDRLAVRACQMRIEVHHVESGFRIVGDDANRSGRALDVVALWNHEAVYQHPLYGAVQDRLPRRPAAFEELAVFRRQRESPTEGAALRGFARDGH